MFIEYFFNNIFFIKKDKKKKIYFLKAPNRYKKFKNKIYNINFILIVKINYFIYNINYLQLLNMFFEISLIYLKKKKIILILN